MQGSRKTAGDSKRAYNSPGDRVAVELAEPRQGRSRRGEEAEPQPDRLESLPDSDIAEDDSANAGVMLREMLAEQQQALRKTMQAAVEMEKTAADATARLAEVQQQLHTSEKELARERLERQRASEAALSVVTELKTSLTVREDALRTVEGLRASDRRLILRLAPGLLLAVALVFIVLKYSPEPAKSTLKKPPPATIQSARATVSAPQGASEAAAMRRLDRALAVFAPAALPGVLKAADRLLIASGLTPCSMEWATGERAMLLNPAEATKAPLMAALTRCATALEHIALTDPGGRSP